MDYRKFIEPVSGSSLFGYRRWFTNWVIERQRLLDSGAPVRLHRLASKRVVFEVEGVAPRDSKRRVNARAQLSIAILFTMAVAISAFFASNTNHESLQAKQSLQLQRSSQPIGCPEISLVGLHTSSIESFQEASWIVTTRELAIDLGEFKGLTFEATCGDHKLSGRLIANHSDKGWQIKRMVLVD